MSHAVMMARSPPCIAAVRTAANKRTLHQAPKKPPNRKTTTAGFGGKKKDPLWQCVQNCGACCKLDKGSNFPSPEEVFEDPSDVQVYKSLVGEDGWCIHYNKSSRKCAIYAERPYFCRVEPEIFHTLYGIDKRKFNKEACSGSRNPDPYTHNRSRVWINKPLIQFIGPLTTYRLRTGPTSDRTTDTIKAVYGIESEELEKFNHAVWSTTSNS